MPYPRLRFGLAIVVNLLFCLIGDAAEPATPSGEVVRLTFAGDIMLDTLPGEYIAAGKDPFADFAKIFAAADASIGNLECVVATTGEKLDKKYTFRAHPRTLPFLRKHFAALSLANNHSGDYGHVAFLEQLDLLRAHQIGYFGGGKNTVEARTPLVLERKGLKIAILGYNEFKPRYFEAGPSWPGLAWSVDEQVTADIRAARTIHKADLVIPFMHWGWEYEPPSDRQRELARLMIDAGADLVVGAHPHVIQQPEYYRGKLIAYSLGNFVFDGFDEPESNLGWVLRLDLNRQGLVKWDTVVAQIDAQGIPHLDRKTPSPRGQSGIEKIETAPFTE